MKKFGVFAIIVLMAVWIIFLSWPKGTVRILGVDNSGVGLPPPPCPNCLTVNTVGKPIGNEKIIISIPANSFFEMSLACDTLSLEKPGSNKYAFLHIKKGHKPDLRFGNMSAWPNDNFQHLKDNIDASSKSCDYIVLIQSDHIMRVTKNNVVMTDFDTIAKELGMNSSSEYGFYREKHVNHLNIKNDHNLEIEIEGSGFVKKMDLL